MQEKDKQDIIIYQTADGKEYNVEFYALDIFWPSASEYAASGVCSFAFGPTATSKPIWLS